MERAHAIALAEKDALAEVLKKAMGLELSEWKTVVTTVTEPIRFLGCHFRVKRHPVWGWVRTILIPKNKSTLLREPIKAVFKRPTCNQPLAKRLEELNHILRGWGHFFRYAWGAKSVFNALDRQVLHTIYRWLRKKHPRHGLRQLAKRYSRTSPTKRSILWSDGPIAPFRLASISVGRYRLANESVSGP